MSARIWLRRAYDPVGRNDGQRILVDRVWPRGVSKEQAQLDEWLADVAPSPELRRWFGHDPERWEEFRRRYREELVAQGETVAHLLDRVRRGRVTLVFGARDEQRNNAVVLREHLEDRR